MATHDDHAPGLLKRLGTMTGIRNTHLLERSLLKTLASILGITDTLLCRFERDGEWRLVGHHPQWTPEPADAATVPAGDDGHEDSRGQHDGEPLAVLPETLRALVEMARRKRMRCTRVHNGQLLIAYPLMVGGVVGGCFLFERGEAPTGAEDGIVHGVLEVFSNYYGLLDASQRDRLTGLLNRHALEECFEKVVSELSLTEAEESASAAHERRQAPRAYWVGVIDIDRFKSINDRYGHIIGDEVLLLVARLMEQTLRSGDALFRYGGEEFVALFSAADERAGLDALDRLRRAVEAYSFPQAGRVTISAGLARVHAAEAPEVVIGHADQALYYAKEHGRNQVHSYDRLLLQGEFREIVSGDLELF